MIERGIDFEVASHKAESLGTCLVLITPDGERTFVIFVPENFDGIRSEAFIDKLLQAKTLLIEGYLLREPKMVSAIQHFIQKACEHQVKVVLNLSDVSVMRTKRMEIRNIIATGVSILIGNRQEMMELFEIHELDDLILKLKKFTHATLITLGHQGLALVHASEVTWQEAGQVQVINKNGAGDAAMGGFLFGIWKNQGSTHCLKLAAQASALVVGQQEAVLNKESMRILETALV